ncbi:MAG: segregation and condensation protein A [Acidimicrobiales bacterium]
MVYEVRTPDYEGPLDLLAQLVVRREVDLWALSLGALVTDYLAEIARMRSLDLEVATEFLVLAATLVELKTRRLLPEPDEPDEDDLALLEERDLLVARLVECLTFRAAGESLARLMDLAARAPARTAGPEPHLLSLSPDWLAGVGPVDLLAAMARISNPAPAERVDLSHVTVVTRTVAQTISDLTATLVASGRACFGDLVGGSTRMDVVVTFLAVLEMTKLGLTQLHQPGPFQRFDVVWTGGIGAMVEADFDEGQGALVAAAPGRAPGAEGGSR